MTCRRTAQQSKSLPIDLSRVFHGLPVDLNCPVAASLLPHIPVPNPSNILVPMWNRSTRIACNAVRVRVAATSPPQRIELDRICPHIYILSPSNYALRGATLPQLIETARGTRSVVHIVFLHLCSIAPYAVPSLGSGTSSLSQSVCVAFKSDILVPASFHLHFTLYSALKLVSGFSS
jgi:hypothetical protein